MIYIEGTHDILADAIIRLDCNQEINTISINDHLSIKALAKLFTCHVRETSGSKEFQSNDPYVLIGSHGVADLLESLRTNDSCSCIWAIASKVLSLLFCMMVIPVVQNNR